MPDRIEPKGESFSIPGRKLEIRAAEIVVRLDEGAPRFVDPLNQGVSFYRNGRFVAYQPLPDDLARLALPTLIHDADFLRLMRKRGAKGGVSVEDFASAGNGSEN